MNIPYASARKNGKINRPAGASHLPDRPNRNGSHEDHVMAVKALPSPEVLRQLLRYEPDTGKLFWLFDGNATPQRNGRYAGKEALTANTDEGYRHGKICGRTMKAHRVAWAVFYGQHPVGHIDHVNGDPSDNRIGNLRIATDMENQWNTAAQCNNSSGYKGVSWHRGIQKWVAQIRVHGEPKHIGSFSTAEEAYAAYCERAGEFQGQFARLK